MLIGKIILSVTAIAATAITAPIVYSAGRIVGRNEARKESENTADKAVERVPDFLHKSHSTKWSNP